MDRASDSGSEGWGFESLPVYQTNIIRTRFSELEKGSDYLFISAPMSRHTTVTVCPYEIEPHNEQEQPQQLL